MARTYEIYTGLRLWLGAALTLLDLSDHEGHHFASGNASRHRTVGIGVENRYYPRFFETGASAAPPRWDYRIVAALDGVNIDYASRHRTWV